MEIKGIKKRVDNLGRLCIPKWMRELYDLQDEVELVVIDNGILIKSCRSCKKKTNDIIQ